MILFHHFLFLFVVRDELLMMLSREWSSQDLVQKNQTHVDVPAVSLNRTSEHEPLVLEVGIGGGANTFQTTGYG